jgi:hypothetical protein
LWSIIVASFPAVRRSANVERADAPARTSDRSTFALQLWTVGPPSFRNSRSLARNGDVSHDKTCRHVHEYVPRGWFRVYDFIPIEGIRKVTAGRPTYELQPQHLFEHSPHLIRSQVLELEAGTPVMSST